MLLSVRAAVVVLLLLPCSLVLAQPDFSKQIADQTKGFTIKKNLSFAIRSVSGDLDGRVDGTHVSSSKDMTLFGLRTEFLLKLSENAKHGWFGGVSFGILKGEYDQDLDVPGFKGSGSGNIDTAFDFDIFAESDYLLSPRWAFLSRAGLAVGLFNAGADKKADQLQDFGASSGDGSMEVFIGFGMDYALNEKSSISAMLRATLVQLTAWTDQDYDNVDYGIYGLQFAYSF